MNNALIVYGTRYGAAADTAEGIAQILRMERFHVKVVNAKEERIRDMADYQLVIAAAESKFTSGQENLKGS